MDVHTDQAGVGEDPATSVLPGQRPGSAQGQLFVNDYPTYADTDRFPVIVAPGGRQERPRKPSRLLRAAVMLTALAVLGAGAALALVETGVISTTTGSGGGAPASPSSTSTTHATTHGTTRGTTPGSSASLLTPVSAAGGTPTYFVGETTYTVTVTTSTGASWVSIGTTGQAPVFAGIVPASSSQKETLTGPSTVQIGAGGTKLTVAAGRRSTTLSPPSAPYTYQFTTRP